MTVRIKRNTGMIGVMVNFSLFVDGEKRGTIENNETAEIEITGKETTIQASQTGIKSNEIIVEDGDEVELVNTFWGSYGRLSIIFIILFVNMLPDLTSKIVGFVLIFAIVFAILYIFPGINYQIKKQEP